MKNKRNKYTIIALLLVLFISIGYAALTTVLKINSNIALGKASFDIHFDNVTETESNSEIIEAAHITNDEKTEISFNVNIPRIGDYYRFTTDIVNEGSIPAKIKSIEFNGLTESQKKLLSYNVFYTISKKTVAVGDFLGPESSKNITIEVLYELSEDISNEDLPTDTLNLECEFIIRFENGTMAEFRSRAVANKLIQDVDFMPTSALNFNNPASADEFEGLYRLDSTINDDFPIYFYRGSSAVKNHVIFGGYCWRIIRTTSTGGIKIIYNGTPNDNGECMTLTGENTILENHEFGSNRNYGSSTLKTWLTTWYFQNMIRNQAYLEDTPFCNTPNTYTNGDISLGCESSYEYSLANGNNTYPVGLISAQEANLCGIVKNTSSNYPWLYVGENYWTISGGSSGGTHTDAGVWMIYNRFSNDLTGNSYGIRPVVSLNSEVVFDTGDGTQEHPYTVSLG